MTVIDGYFDSIRPLSQRQKGFVLVSFEVQSLE